MDNEQKIAEKFNWLDIAIFYICTVLLGLSVGALFSGDFVSAIILIALGFWGLINKGEKLKRIVSPEIYKKKMKIAHIIIYSLLALTTIPILISILLVGIRH